MNMRKTVKKIAALVAGTTMVGATIMGAMALDLSNYPAPFVTNGVFSGKIVVGAKAATSDVVGAIDIAASLQAAATTTTQIQLPDTAGKATVTGDSAEFKTGSDVVSLGENLRDNKGTFSALDLTGLKNGVFDTGVGSTPVEQYLRFDPTTAGDKSGLTVVYNQDSNNDDKEGDYMYVASDGNIFEYQLLFTEGATSDIDTGGVLTDLEKESVTIMGAPFTVVSAKVSGTQIDMTMLGGQVADVLKDGETKTYTINGKDYEVTAVFISSDSQSAKLSVNGMLTKELTSGKTQVLGSDVTIGVQEVLTNQREGLVEFYLGANKIQLTDSDYTTDSYQSGGVKVGTKTINNAYLDIKATNQSTTQIKLNFIKYKLTANDNTWVPAGKGIKAYLEQPEAMLTDKWDILYAGFTDATMSTIQFKGVSDYGYKLNFENLNGVKYSIPFLTNKDTSNIGFKYGDQDHNFIFTEVNDGNTSDGNLTADKNTFISKDDYFAVSDGTSATKSDKAVTNVLRYRSLSTTDSTVTFEDISTGDSYVVSYTGTLGSSATGQLIVGGATHNFWIGNTSSDVRKKYALAMDLDASGAVTNADEVKLVNMGGGIIDMGANVYNATGVPAAIPTTNTYPINVTITPVVSRFDDANAFEIVKVSLGGTGLASNQMSATVNGTLYEVKDNDKYSRRMTKFGALEEKYTPDTSSSNSDVTISYPAVQRYAQAFVTMGNVAYTAGQAAAGGTVDTTKLNPIAVGLAVLDTDALASLGTTNLIVVGGPCANTVAAALMGNPADCAQGFTAGKAIIKLYADKNALLVAGYEAQETLGASYVLAGYKDYKLTGTEVEVAVADLNSITVKPVV